MTAGYLVHPRVRGDNFIPASLLRTETGSPPRARGQLGDWDKAAAEARFTPACAGTTRYEQ